MPITHDYKSQESLKISRNILRRTVFDYLALNYITFCKQQYCACTSSITSLPFTARREKISSLNCVDELRSLADQIGPNCRNGTCICIWDSRSLASKNCIRVPFSTCRNCFGSRDMLTVESRFDDMVRDSGADSNLQGPTTC